MKLLTGTVLFLVLLLSGLANAAQVSLSWSDNSTNETGFNVERRLLSDPVTGYAKIFSTGAGVASYVDNTVVVNTVYCYRVQAFNASATSAYTNEACMLITPTGLVLVYTP